MTGKSNFFHLIDLFVTV